MYSSFKILEQKLETLIVTKNLLALKAEFEAEGTRLEELASLSNLCIKYNIPLTLKIGGPLAQRDIYEAFQIGVNNILAPMVESSTAILFTSKIFKKYLKLFRPLDNSTGLFINIESELGIRNLDSLLNTIKLNHLNIGSIVIGRTDLSSSFGIDNVNSSKIFNLSQIILERATKYSIPVTLGGNISKYSFKFIKDLSLQRLNAFETRMCTFKISEKFSKLQFEELLSNAFELEVAWLKYKKSINSNRSEFQDRRIRSIISRDL